MLGHEKKIIKPIFKRSTKGPKVHRKYPVLAIVMSLGFNPEIPLLEYLVKDGHVGGELFAKTVYATRQRKQLKSQERERFVHYEILIK